MTQAGLGGAASLIDRDAEWLEADRLGGYASGTVGGIRTRRYHALLLAATTPPTIRDVLVNGAEVWVEAPAGPVYLSAQRYSPDTVYPDGAERLTAFGRDPWPTWRWTLPDGSAVTHELFVAPDACETVLRWRHTGGGIGPRLLHVRLLLSGRDYNDLQHENAGFRFDASVVGGNVAWRPYPGQPAVAALTNGAYAHAPDWYRSFLYATERDRGLDDTEDLASPGLFTFDLAAGDAVMILRAGDGLTVEPVAHAATLAAAERARRGAIRSPLARAAQSYRVARGEGQTIMAGFPWFTDWGRDTFIAMRGLVLGTGELDAAVAILTAWSGMVSEGMLPNRFPERGTAPEFNAVDASLWFVIAVHETLDACAAAGRPVPDAVAGRLAAAAVAILDGYAAGTRFGIRLDRDGLLAAGVPGVQLTWMDAKTGDTVWTPRIGKPVEVQALWINALHIAATRWDGRWPPSRSGPAAFAARFPNPAGGLYDVVDVGHVAGTADGSVRPNQIFAVGGLPLPLLTGAAARAVVDLVEAKLLTPLGLRTLAPDDPRYIAHYRGDLAARDAAYHQGTAWPWLMGPFVESWLAVRQNGESAKAEGRARFLPPFRAHLDHVGLGHVSEVLDGDPPYTPGGCPFQAWSLGELIRIGRMLDAAF